MLKISRIDDVAVIALDRPPVNAIDLDLVEALETSCGECSTDEPLQGVVLTSANPKVFSSGFDLKTLGELNRPKFELFIKAFSELARAIFTFPKPVVAALPGHAIAGGYILASNCDRILLAEGPATVGLPEIKLGVPIPAPNLEVLRHRLGNRPLGEVILGGESYLGPRALELGLVDRVVPAADLQTEAVALVHALSSHPGGMFTEMKARLRKKALHRVDAATASELGPFADAWFSAPARDAREALLASLSKKG